MLADFVRGFYYFLTGLKMIRQPALMRYVWIPLLCNIVLFLFMLVFAGYGLNLFSEWVEQFLPHWLQWLRWLIWVLSMLFSGIVLIYLSTVLVNLVAGPFNSLLSEKVIAQLNVSDKSNQVSLIKALPMAFSRQMKFILYYVLRSVFFLILFIIPFVQIFAAFFWFLFNAWVFTMQYLDYPMDNHGINIKKMRDLMVQKRELCLGFGSAVVIFSLIPLVNFVVVPVAVVGATILWVNEYRLVK